LGQPDPKKNSKPHQLEILIHVLNYYQQPQSSFQVMQKVYTSSEPTAGYLLKLQKLGFLEVAGAGTKYVTSAKGSALLEEWQKISAL
jgi:predicted transcriptional regulator